MIPRYSRNKISRIWEPENKFKIWLKIEILICEALNFSGKIPSSALAVIKQKAKFKVFFVSIDPERDSPEIIKEYLNSFENKMFGITGDPKKNFFNVSILGGSFRKNIYWRR